MKLILTFFFLVVFTQLNSQINKPIGINLAAVTDYSTEFVFTDAFKQSREWISSNAAGGGPWDTGIPVPLDPNGFPLELPYNDGINPPQALKTLLLWDLGAAIPLGNYRLIVEGTGQVKLSNGANGIFSCPVDTLIPVNNGVILELLSSNSSDPIHSIQFIYPNYTSTFSTQTFTNELTDFLIDFQTIRFMDWMRTNASNVVTWGDRTLPTNYSQAMTNGVSWEYAIELCNETQKNMWVNIPHKADDNYIQELANLLQSQLNPNLKIYLEYSNELWNGAFSQNTDCANFATAIGYTGQPWEKTWKYTAKRSADVFHIFDSIFVDNSRFIKIIPSQAANSWLTNELLTYFEDPFYNPSQISADAVTIAPYFAGGVANEIVIDGVENTITVPEIVSRMQNALAESFTWITDNKQVADNHTVDLICYEGGQHLVGTGGNENIDPLTLKLNAANHHPDLEHVYCDYFDYWYANAGDLFCHFSSHGFYSKWGSWGIKETMTDSLNPKYLALKSCVIADNSLSIEEQNSNSEFSVYPNPTTNFIQIESLSNSNFTYSIFDAFGKEVISNFTSKQVDLSILNSGIYTLVISSNNTAPSPTSQSIQRFKLIKQ